MSRTVTQIDVSTDTFELWVNRTNDLLLALSTEIITANDATANTGTVGEPRRAQLYGRFGANTLVATDNLRGGNVGDLGSALLTISSNTTVGGNSTIGIAQNFVSYANVLFENANTQVNAEIITITGNSFIKGNTSIVAINVLGNSTVTNTIINGTDVFVRTTNTSVNSISIFTGNTSIKANSTITLISATGNGTTSNVVLSGNLTQITSNLNVTGTVHTIAGNVAFDTSTLFVDATGNKVGVGTITPDANLHIVGTANVSGAVKFANSLVVTGNVTFANTLSVTGNATFSNTINLRTDSTFTSFANGNLGSDVSTALTIFSFNKNEYSSAKITSQIKTLSGNTMASEMVLAHNTTDAYITVYATVVSPLTADPGDYSVDISGDNVQLKFKQNSITSASKVVATLIK